jgi:ATP-dependent helicase/nuclease subunit B
MAESRPHLFTIPPSASFLPTLAGALLHGQLIADFAPHNDPFVLADTTIYLPTRRAARAFGLALLERLGADAMLLPRILPLGDIDEDELAFTEEIHSEGILPAIPASHRKLVLARLVREWAKSLSSAINDPNSPIAATPATSLALADELARVFDDLTLAGISFEQFEEIIPDYLDKYWDLSRKFLRIVREQWPAFLAEKNFLDAAVRRDNLLARETARLATLSGGPVIAAGSTGTLPSVVKLLAAIANRPNGAVVLPGLDTMLDDPSYDLIDGGKNIDPSQGHPQFGLKRLLRELHVKRADVVSLAEPSIASRERLLSEAFRPAATTDRWNIGGSSSAYGDDALSNITVVEAADSHEEALTVAVYLREVLEMEGQHAALITPDRALARRVAAELTRWGIAVNDSAGTPLSETEAGRFARLTATVVAERLAPVPLVAFLRHPLSDLTEDVREIDALQLGVLLGPRPAPGAKGLRGAIETRSVGKFHSNDPRAKLTPADWAAAASLAGRIEKALSPLSVLDENRAWPLQKLLEAHRKVLQASGLDSEKADRPDVRKLAEAFDELTAASVNAFDVSLPEYADAFGELIAAETLHPPFEANAHIRILGPLEARLMTFNRVVLGALNEDTWPRENPTDAFLNRPMRRALKLNLPERFIGLAAHDFVQAMGTREVVVTRARRQAGAETVASRFWQRIAAVAPAKAWASACQRGMALIALANRVDSPDKSKTQIERPTVRPQRPAPRPPADARPIRLSVTEIADLVRDPYTIYARHILSLIPLEEIDADPGAADRGVILHEALARFVRKFPKDFPENAAAELFQLGEAAFKAYQDFPSTPAVWWPRFQRVAHWFVSEERERRKAITSLFAEIRGEISFDIAGKSFTLSARADRIDLFKDGSIGVVDYKTGEVPTLRQAIAGLAPQLPLEAAIMREGGFKEIGESKSITDIIVIRLSGGNPAGEVKSLKPSEATGRVKTLLEKHKITTCDDLAAFALARLKTLLANYANEKTPYLSIPRPKWRLRYGKYDHLARIKEWSETAGGSE